MISQEKPKRFVSRVTKNTLALVLAGGRGSRLKGLTDWRTKPAVPFGGKFKIIDFPLSNCINSDIRRIAVLTQYKAHSLIQHLQRGWGFLRSEMREFVAIVPAQQRANESWYAGTADAVWQNMDIIKEEDPEYILILAGDHIYKMDYGEMIAHHVENNADMTIGCLQVDLETAKGFGVMSVDDNMRIIDFNEKPDNPTPTPDNPDLALASMGIYVFNSKFLYEQLEKDAWTKDSDHDFGKNIIPNVIHKYQVSAYPFVDKNDKKQPYWRDVGTIDSFHESNLELVGVTPELDIYDKDWPLWTYQEQLPPAKFIFNDKKEGRRGMAIDSMVSGGCIISGAKIKQSVLFSNVYLHSYSSVKKSVILPNVDVAEHARISNAIIDEDCKIPEGMVIGEDLELDRQRFYVSEKGVVLVTADMLAALAA